MHFSPLNSRRFQSPLFILFNGVGGDGNSVSRICPGLCGTVRILFTRFCFYTIRIFNELPKVLSVFKSFVFVNNSGVVPKVIKFVEVIQYRLSKINFFPGTLTKVSFFLFKSFKGNVSHLIPYFQKLFRFKTNVVTTTVVEDSLNVLSFNILSVHFKTLLVVLNSVNDYQLLLVSY